MCGGVEWSVWRSRVESVWRMWIGESEGGGVKEVCRGAFGSGGGVCQWALKPIGTLTKREMKRQNGSLIIMSTVLQIQPIIVNFLFVEIMSVLSVDLQTKIAQISENLDPI